MVFGLKWITFIDSDEYHIFENSSDEIMYIDIAYDTVIIFCHFTLEKFTDGKGISPHTQNHTHHTHARAHHARTRWCAHAPRTRTHARTHTPHRRQATRARCQLSIL